MYIRLIFPGSASGIFARVESKKFEPFPAEKIDEVIHLYKAGENVVTPECGTMKVLFKPSGVSVLLTRILYSTNAKSVYEKTSPIMEKTGEKIFDPEFTLYDDPLDDNYPWAQSFDDEGTKCTPISIIENGILKNFYSDLHYAQKLGTNSTGHGYKSGYFAIGNKPVPTLQHIKINPGTTPFEKLVQSMDKGIILEGSIGGHSGNIPNGDFSVGINSGFYVENGEIKGRVKDAMLAGNIYETLNHIIAIEDTQHDCWSGLIPSILCDDVSIATQG